MTGIVKMGTGTGQFAMPLAASGLILSYGSMKAWTSLSISVDGCLRNVTIGSGKLCVISFEGGVVGLGQSFEQEKGFDLHTEQLAVGVGQKIAQVGMKRQESRPDPPLPGIVFEQLTCPFDRKRPYL
jgi:hypothetical protein